ncbi:putative TonB receptor protein [Salmonella phage Solent]|uniref:Uncharacterized protein n=1 Tax=Salmonella phage vB_SenS_Sasha TaxID=1913114 RepID=A0A1P8DTQ7_9CAUD|nr:hypothetical protein HOR37_gp65 [Salmonella phage vB_SenS_Sasha]APU92912.1 hypothetical protein CPTSergei_75 [Salmonella phage vB_SenS_Sergei]AXY86244.1 putative TonB receptor protein [Salmonella phage Solent]EKI0438336.1 hypothetical protein [Salmonella enterica]MDI4883421.1 hypothetical protein [Salmonella enterica subsp. enterica serovar Anatum]APU92821.1 hypothetical protein CPTSasha_65 [Salmonella phage vB_SenS_Sasha]
MFEVKLLVTAPGLETAINNLAAAIATGAAPLMTAQGDGITKETVTVVAESLPVVSATTEDIDYNETSTEEFDKWGLRHDPRIHTDSKSLNKGDGLWRQKKKLDEAFVDGVKRELIAEAVEAGRYTGPAELAPGYVAPVDPAPAVPAAPVAPVVPAAPAAPVEQPVTTDPAKVYNTQVLQSALMQMFGQITGDRAAPLSQRIMGLYETQNVMQIDDPVKLKSIIELIERINATPADAENIVGQAESVKQMGGAF